MNLEQASVRTYKESQIIALVRAMHPDIPEEIIQSIFNHAFAMGSLYGMAEAAATAEKAILDFARGGDAVH